MPRPQLTGDRRDFPGGPVFWATFAVLNVAVAAALGVVVGVLGWLQVGAFRPFFLCGTGFFLTVLLAPVHRLPEKGRSAAYLAVLAAWGAALLYLVR